MNTNNTLTLLLKICISTTIILTSNQITAQDFKATYLRSNTNNPWGQSITNESSMDSVFGINNWNQLFFETVNPNLLFSSEYNFIFLEGSENGASEFNSFYQTNISTIQNWVNNGGRLFVNSAPNEGSDINLGFGGFNLNYNSYSRCGIAADPLETIFQGPFTPINTIFTGNYFSHAVICPDQIEVKSLITDTEGTKDILVAYVYGSGQVLFGAMTTPNYHCTSGYEGCTPLPCTNTEARNLRTNIIHYTAFYNTNCNSNKSLNLFDCTSVNLNDSTYTQSGTYTQTLTNAAGCDSILTIDVDILNSEATIDSSYCDSLVINGIKYTSTGTYMQTLMNAAGCDSVLTINAAITPCTCDDGVMNGDETGVDCGNEECGPCLSIEIEAISNNLFPKVQFRIKPLANDTLIDSLMLSHLVIMEEGQLQDKNKVLIPPQEVVTSGAGSSDSTFLNSALDIVFIVDNSGSMGSLQSEIQTNLDEFIDTLAGRNYDVSLGLTRYGQGTNGGNPIIEDGGVFTSDLNYFQNTVFARNQTSGSHEPAFLAAEMTADSFDFRPNSTRMFILVTDEEPNQGTTTQQDAINAMNEVGANLFVLTTPGFFSNYSLIVPATDGGLFNVNDGFVVTIDGIVTELTNFYMLEYESCETTVDCELRDVSVTLDYMMQSAIDSAMYRPVDICGGCTDPDAYNYDPNANADDGSCETCSDGIQNGNELLVDCGGSYPGCPVCVSGCTDSDAHNYDPIAHFDNGSCLTCYDGLLNGDETAIDCGGAICEPCSGCTDTLSSSYDPLATVDDGSCAYCDDGIMNGDEEGIDCGGSNCGPCSRGRFLFLSTSSNYYSASLYSRCVTPITDIDLVETFHYHKGRFYFNEFGTDKIESVALYGIIHTVEVEADGHPPVHIESFDIHRSSDVIYFTDLWSNRILHSTSDKNNVVEIISHSDIDFASRISINEDDGLLYWNNFNNGKIYQANLDGSNLMTLRDGGAPIDVHYDHSNGQIYWTDRIDDIYYVLHSDVMMSEVDTLFSTTDILRTLITSENSCDDCGEPHLVFVQNVSENEIWAISSEHGIVAQKIGKGLGPFRFTYVEPDTTGCRIDPSAYNFNTSFINDCICETCDDGIMNGDEQGVDCGGSYPGCLPCVSGCTDVDAHNYELMADIDDGSCLTCTDNLMNGDETGVDCGGSRCEPCSGCTEPGTHNYDPVATEDDESCETCHDGIQNGDELDIDCGGLLCAPCCFDTMMIQDISIVSDTFYGATEITLSDLILTDNASVQFTARSLILLPEVEITEGATFEIISENGCDIIGCTDINAHNFNPRSEFDDGSCETCTDGILNGDEIEIDCGGLKCNPCISNCPELFISRFEKVGNFFYSTYKNIGDQTAAAPNRIVVQRYWSLDGNPSNEFAGGWTIVSLPPNDSVTRVETHSNSNNRPYLVLEIDRNQSISECNEDNNFFVYEWSSGLRAGCVDPNAHNYESFAEVDLGSCMTCNDGSQNGDEEGIDCGGVRCIPCSSSNCIDLVLELNYRFISGQHVFSDYIITNIGNVSVNLKDVFIGNYASDDTIIDLSDEYVGGTRFLSDRILAPGESTTELNSALNRTNSHRYLIARIDDNFNVPECSDTNNSVYHDFGGSE